MLIKHTVALQAFLYAATILGGASMACAQTGPNANYAEFSTLSDVSNVQIRLVYVGALEDEPTPPVILVTSGKTADPAKFRSFQRSGVVYPSPSVGTFNREITTAQMQQLIANVGSVPAVSSGTAASSPWLAFALCNTAGDTIRVAEAILNKADTPSLIQQIGAALHDNPQALASVTELACSIGGLGSERPTDVSSSVTVTIGGARLNRKTGEFVAKATLTNASSNAIAGPISLVFTFSQPGVSLSNASGVTCGTTPTGLGYINAALSNNSLAPGASVDISLIYATPDSRSLAAQNKVLAGPGAR